MSAPSGTPAPRDPGSPDAFPPRRLAPARPMAARRRRREPHPRAPGDARVWSASRAPGRRRSAAPCSAWSSRPSGEIRLVGQDITRLSQAALRPLRRREQIVFQNPYASLNPRRLGRRDRRAAPRRPPGPGRSCRHGRRPPPAGWAAARRGAALPARVLGRPAPADRDRSRPRAPPGSRGRRRDHLGARRDRQAPGPRAPAASSSPEFHVAYLFISHDLAVVRQVADRVAVMYLGQIVEEAPTEALFERPLHPYTQVLRASVPPPDPTVAWQPPVLSGDPPSALSIPPGCRFHPRCPIAESRCRVEPPDPARARPRPPGRLPPGLVTASARSERCPSVERARTDVATVRADP